MPPIITAPPDSGIITDVNVSLWRYVRLHYWWELTILFAMTIGWEFLILAYVAPVLFEGTAGTGSGRGLANLIFLPVILFVSWYWRLKKKFEDSFLAQFAQANGYTYSLNGSVDETYGTIFRIDGTPTVSDVISGSYKGANLRLFLYDLTAGSGRSRVTYRNTVIELDLNGNLPDLMLVAKHSINSGLDLVGTSGLTNRLSLEGNFDQEFTLYAQPGRQVEALEVFAPDIMAIMEDESRGYDVEFVANRIYIYVGKYIDNNQTLEHSFELARRLIEKVGPIAGRLSGDTAIPKAPVNIIAHRAPSQRSRVLEFLYVGSIAVMVTVAIILGSAAHRQYARDVDESPAYLAAVKQAEVDDAAGDRGPRVVVDGQQALMAATTDLGRSGAEYWIGIGYFWQKLYATALAHEQQAISYDPKDSSAIIAAGNLLVNTDQNQAAITMANKELAIDASDASAYRVMAFAHYNLGMKVQALADINKATSLDQAPGKQQYRSGDAQDATLIQSSIYTKLIFDPN